MRTIILSSQGDSEMSWWYENEKEKMELYKNEDLCIECKNDFFSKPYDHRDPTPGTIGYCIKCDNFLIKEKKMEFDRDRVYGAVNADELRAGDKVIVGDSLRFLRQEVEGDGYIETLKEVLDESHLQRFKAKERKENCTNCGEGRWDAEHKKILCDPVNCGNGNVVFRNQEIEVCEYWKPKTKQKNKKEIDMNWNYVNEGKLPERQEIGVSDRVVVAVRGYNVPDVGYYDYELEAWFVDGNRYPVPVYAWHYDKPPREE